MATNIMKMNIKKDFSKTEINNVIVKKNFLNSEEKEKKAENIGKKIEDFIKNTNDVIYFSLSKNIIDVAKVVIKNVKDDVLKYILVNQIEENNLIELENKCIIHECNTLGNINYIIFDNKYTVVFDNELHGYYFEDEKLSRELSRIFKNNFWKNSQKEFIDKIVNITTDDCPFDQIPIINSDSEKIFIDTLKTPLDEELKKATDIYIPNFYPKNSDMEKFEYCKTFYGKKINQFKEETLTLFFDKKIKVKYCTEKTFINTICVDGRTYLLNFNPIAENEHLSKLNAERFAILIDEKIGDFVNYEVFEKINYENCVNREAFKISNNEIQDFKIIQENKIQKQYFCDYKEFKQLAQNNSLIENKIELTQNNERIQAVIVEFKIIVTLKEQSIYTKAKIYEEYENYKKSQDIYLKTISRTLEKIIKVFSEIEKSVQKKDDLTLLTSINEIKFSISQKNKDFSKSLKTILKTKSDVTFNITLCEQLKTQIINKTIIPQKFLENKKISECIDNVIHEVEVLNNLQSVSKDLPKYGILFEQNNKFEYLIDLENNLEKAIVDFQNNYHEKNDVSYMMNTFIS